MVVKQANTRCEIIPLERRFDFLINGKKLIWRSG